MAVDVGEHVAEMAAKEACGACQENRLALELLHGRAQPLGDLGGVFRQTTRTSGTGTMNRPPASLKGAFRAMIESAKFHASTSR